ncbi:GAF and ANTAR domain-containing protein [Arthrobacter sp. NEB 688]|uniref:GAF and ANTAR domain-containing protein n=1 Tax=Arthrobacter sp. NEB 688 TaxID=904039 RepID=UPI0015671C46|nr:GAF and ANTAR domain-containing protein [Arthrobacter sp. NEB 688]QKE85091.1 GAF and ANTAR domain-containing protein [Arthrobacter sp. NEB 688]
MNRARESEVVRAFVALAGEKESERLMTSLATSCVSLLPITAAGVLVAVDGRLTVMAATPGLANAQEVLLGNREEGPCVEAFRTRAPVTSVDLAEAADRWPSVSRMAVSSGLRAVHALPLQLQQEAIGSLGLFGEAETSMSAPDLALARALAHVATIAIVNARVVSGQTTVTAQLQRALDSRVVIEQAKGMIAGEGAVDMEEAFGALRGYARDRGEQLAVVAASVVGRSTSATSILRHTTTRS